MLAPRGWEPAQVAAPVRPSHVRTPEAWPLALVVAVLDLALGLYLDLGLHYISGDGFSRVANAYDVLFGRDPHLAAVGFIWNPLPSLLEVPLLLFSHLWRPLAADAVAGLIVSAVFGGVAVYHLCRILRRLDVPSAWRIALTVLFAANPMIAFYSANGMSDIMLVGAMMAAIDCAVDYLDTHRVLALAATGVWLAVAFAIRYEGAPLGVCLALGLALGMAWQGRTAQEVRGSLLIVLAPLVYAGFMWVYVNWLIMKQPLYFLESSYGNLSQTSIGSYVLGDAALQAAHHHPVGTLLFVMRMAALFWPVGIGLAAALILCLRRLRTPLAPLLIGATVGMPLLAVLVFGGHSGGWARYFIYYIPDGFLLLALAATRFRRGAWRTAALLVAALLCVAGNVGTLHEETTSSVVGYGDIGTVNQLILRRPVVMYREPDEVVRYLNAHPHMSVLLDSYLGYPIVLRVRNPRQLIITSDVDFMSVLENPAGRVQALLVPKPTDVGALDAVDRAWPMLWSGKVRWARRIATFPGQTGWRLYAVGEGAP